MSCNSNVCSPFCTEVYSSIKQSKQKAAALGFQQDSWSAMSTSGDELVPDSLDAGEPLKVSPAGVSKAMSSLAPIQPGSSTQSPVPPSPINEDGESLKSALQIASGVCVFHVAPCLPQLRVKGAKKLRSPRAMRRWSGVRALPLRLSCKA